MQLDGPVVFTESLPRMSRLHESTAQPRVKRRRAGIGIEQGLEVNGRECQICGRLGLVGLLPMPDQDLIGSRK